MNWTFPWRPRIGVAGGILAALVCLAGWSESWAQQPPYFTDLFRDPPRTDQLTQADLPNLGRLLVLEATSMFVHTRAELSDSHDTFRLLEEITTLRNAADEFTAAVAFYPTLAQRIEAGRLSFPDVQMALDQVRASFSRLPGTARTAAVNLVHLNRLSAVIPPLLRQDPPGTAPDELPTRAVQNRADLAAQARELTASIRSLSSQVDESSKDEGLQKLRRELGTLLQLARGFERIVETTSAEQDVVSALRPLRVQSQAINPAMERGGPGLPRGNGWRAIRQRIDALSDRFQLPRELVGRAAAAPAPKVDQALLERIDQTIGQINAFLGQPAADPARVEARRALEPDARRLQGRLELLRQHLLNRDPDAPVHQALLEVQGARRRLNDRMNRAPGARSEASTSLIQNLDATIAAVRKHLSTPH